MYVCIYVYISIYISIYLLMKKDARTNLCENPQMLHNLIQIKESSMFIKPTPMLSPIVIGRITYYSKANLYK